MAEMRWTRETLEAQDPADLDDLMAALTVQRMVRAPERALAYGQIGEAETVKMDLALIPDLLEDFNGR